MNIHKFKKKYGTKTLGLLVQRLICESGFANPHENAEDLELIEMTIQVVTDLERALDQMDARGLSSACACGADVGDGVHTIQCCLKMGGRTLV